MDTKRVKEGWDEKAGGVDTGGNEGHDTKKGL